MTDLATVQPPLQPELAGPPGAHVVMTGRGCGDVSLSHDPAAAMVNRRRALRRIDAALADAVFAEQVHGARVSHVGADDRGRGAYDPGGAIGGADALVTTDFGVALCIQTADCVPVALAAGGDRGGVGAVHAGRQGVGAGVVGTAVAALRDVSGAACGQVSAVIGPAIGGCCYEVPAELAAQACAASPAAPATTRWGTTGLDLPAAVRAQLQAVGVKQVRSVGACTHCDDDRWFSHRAWQADAAPPGRQMLAVLAAAPVGPGATTPLDSR